MDKNLKQLEIERDRLLNLLYCTECGANRREKILEWLKDHPEGLRVNCRYHLKISKDRDLQSLLKKGRIFTKRVINAHKRNKYTYIIHTDYTEN